MSFRPEWSAEGRSAERIVEADLVGGWLTRVQVASYTDFFAI